MSGSTTKSRRKAFRRPYRVGRSRTGLGGFATRLIKKKELIDRYRGQLITNEEADKRDNRYMFEVNSKWTIDGSNRRNLARYFNHSCRPNAESDVKGHKVFIYAKRDIQPGEEITYDYGKDYFNVFLKPIGCKCDKCLEKRAKERAEKRAAARPGKAATTAKSTTKSTRTKKAAAEVRAAAADKKQVVKRGKAAGTKAASKAAKTKATTKTKATKTKATTAKTTKAVSKVKQAAAGKRVSKKTKAVSQAKKTRKAK